MNRAVHRRCWRTCLRTLVAFLPLLAGAVEAGHVELVSKAAPPLVPWSFGGGEEASISADGRYVAFSSASPNMIAGQSDGNSGGDVFLWDRVTGAMTLVSRSIAGSTTTGNYGSGAPRISADGRWVAFRSMATNLVSNQPPYPFPPLPPNPNPFDPRPFNVFLWDRVTGDMVLVSRAAGSADRVGNGASGGPVISADGGAIAYTSLATDLVTGQSDSNGGCDIFVYDRASGSTALVSRTSASATTAGNDVSCGSYQISADGVWVAFDSEATDLVAGQTSVSDNNDVFLYDRTSGTTTLISRASSSSTTEANASSFIGGLSADGSFVVFSSHASNLVAGQSGPVLTLNVFLYERGTGAVMLVSRVAGAPTTVAHGSFPSMSADGAFVVFTSDASASTLVPGATDTNDDEDVFLYERATGSVSLVSHASGAAATTGNGASFSSSISPDGSRVAFQSAAMDLVSGQTDLNGSDDAFLYDRAAGTNLLVSHAVGSMTTTAAASILFPEFGFALSTDAGYLAFTSSATDLTAQSDGNGNGNDVFLYDRTAGTNTAISFSPPVSSVAADRISAVSAFSRDGRWVALQSSASNLVPGQTTQPSSFSNVFLHDRFSGMTTLVSRSSSSPTTTGNDISFSPVVSADGAWVAFVSRATDFAPALYGDSRDNLFLYDRAQETVALVTRRATNPDLGAGGTSRPNISADGRFVVFQSTSPYLVPGQVDANDDIILGDNDVFLFDRVANTMTLVSHSSASPVTAGNGHSFSQAVPSPVTPDGRYVVFTSYATNLVPGLTDANGGLDVFLFDRDSGTTTLVSRSTASGTTAGNAPVSDVEPVALSADGRYVAFLSNATDHVSGVVDANGLPDLFLFDRVSGTTTLVSHTSGSATTASSGRPHSPSLSDDGRYLAFDSTGTDLISGQIDANQDRDVFLFDRVSGTTSLVSRVPSFPVTTDAGAFSYGPSISADGRAILFYSYSANLVPGQSDANAESDVFLFERISGKLTLVSRSILSSTTTGNASSSLASAYLSGDGSLVAFTSNASDLVSDDYNNGSDAFVFSLGHDFFTAAPCRLFDSRQPADGPALASGVTEILTIPGFCGIPASARVISVNITVTQPTGAGHLTFHPGGAAAPLASTINFAAGQTRANNAILPLAGDGTLAVTPVVAGSGTVHVIVDVNGYFE